MKLLNILKASHILVIALFFAISFVGANAQQVEITSDSFVVDDNSNSAVFSGNVIIKQPDLMVWADKVVVRYGDGGPSDLRDFEALGNVKIKQPEQMAFGDKGVYNPKTKILMLYGNVKVTNDSGTITGSELIVDIVAGTSSFPSTGDGGRVTAIFSTQ